MGLRLSRGVNWDGLWRKYRPGAPPPPEAAMADLLDQGMLRFAAPRLSITPGRQFLTEGVIGEILALKPLQ